MFTFYEHVLLHLFLESSSPQKYREKKEKESDHESAPSDSDNDDDVAAAAPAAENPKPTSDKSKLDFIQQYFKQKLGLSVDDDDDVPGCQLLKTVDFQGLTDYWNEHGFKNIITMVGAGISTCKN